MRFRILSRRPSERTEGATEQATAGTFAEDLALVEALRAGDAPSAAKLFDRVQPSVRRTLRRLLRADAEIEDLEQRVMMELVSSLHRFRGDCPLDRWAARVAAHVACKHIRRLRLERGIFESSEAGELDVAADARPDRDALLRNAAERVQKLIDQIEPTRAEAFLLHDVCGHDLREVAEITQTSVAAAQSRLSRGRRDVQKLIAEDEGLQDVLNGLRGTL